MTVTSFRSRPGPLPGLALMPLLLLATGSLAATDYSKLIAELQRDIVRELRGEKIAGAGIVLVDGSDVVWMRTFGYASVDEKRALRPDTPTAVGDFAKLFTTVAVLQQVAAGKLELDAPITAYGPFRFDARDPGWRAPTVRELLTHHAGLPPNVYADSFRESLTEEVWIPDPIPLAQAPGTIYSYSQLGFQLAARLVEVASGQPFDAYVAERIATPLELAGTGFRPPAAAAAPHDKRRRQAEPIYPRDIAALGLYSTLEDIARILRWVVSDGGAPLLPDTLAAAMETAQNEDIDLDLDNRVGLGWQMTNTNNHGIDRVLRLNAAVFRHRALILVAPDQDLAVAMIANSSAAGATVFDQSVAALDGMLAVKAGIPIPEEERPLPERLELPAGATIGRMGERYGTPLGELEVDGDGESYDLRLAGRRFGANQRDDGWYEISFKVFGVISVRFSVLAEVLIRPARIAGRDVLLAHFRGSDLLLGAALPPPLGSTALAEWEGDYRLANPDPLTTNLEIEEAELDFEDGRLYLEYELPGIVTLTPRVPLVPFGADRLYVPGLGLNTGDTVRLVRDGDRRVLEFSGWRLVEE